MLKPLKNIRVWRFGLYYFLVFGCFVGFSQWLVPYFVGAYYLPLVTAGILASCFSFPSGVIRAIGGWMSDKWGARKVMYWVLGSSTVLCLMLIVPKMEIYSPGQAVVAARPGIVTGVNSKAVVVGDKSYSLIEKQVYKEDFDEKLLVFPTKTGMAGGGGGSRPKGLNGNSSWQKASRGSIFRRMCGYSRF